MRVLSRSAPPELDSELTYFTIAEASEFRRLVERAFAGVGRNVTVYPDRVEDRSGTTFQLWNIGELCRGVALDDWAALIDEHVGLVTTPARDVAALSQAELESGLHLRLIGTASAPDADSLGYARVVAPGLLEVLSVDLEDFFALPSREELACFGTTAALVARGRENLRAILADDGLRVETVDEHGRGAFTAVTGDSSLVASLALLLPDVLQRLTGEDDWGRGALVAVPSRHRLLFRPVDTGGAAQALEQMARAALRAFGGEPGALTPDVFWVRGGRWAQVTSYASGKRRMLRGTGLREALKGL
jgi:hypothetical protein